MAFDRAIEIDPDDAGAHTNRGTFLNNRLGRPAEALKEFDRAQGYGSSPRSRLTFRCHEVSRSTRLPVRHFFV